MSLHDIAARALHALDPEDAHGWAIKGLKMGLGPRQTDVDDPILACTIAHLPLSNCVGLAAGFDKNAEVPAAMSQAGFGFVECGTVTPLAQDGNPRPRLFRLTEDQAVINRMGFNNEGLEPFAARLSALKTRRASGGRAPPGRTGAASGWKGLSAARPTGRPPRPRTPNAAPGARPWCWRP